MKQLVILLVIFAFISLVEAEERCLIKVKQIPEHLQDKTTLRYQTRDFSLLSLSSEVLKEFPTGYSIIIDKGSEEDKYFFVYFRGDCLEDKEREIISKYGQILDFFDHTAIIKGKPEEIVQLSEKGFKLKLLPEKIPWPKEISYFAPPIYFKTSAEETADTQIIKEILQSFATGQYAQYIQDLQNFETRYSFSPRSITAKDYLVSQFQGFSNLTVSTHSFTYGVTGNTTHYNVIATLPGKNPAIAEKSYILCAHYDSTVSKPPYDPMLSAPGADDNASGVSALLLAAEYLSKKEFNATIKFIAFAAEEQGMKGSQAYVKEMYDQDAQILGVINLDMIAWCGENVIDDLEITCNTNSLWLAKYLKWINDKYVLTTVETIQNDYAWWGDHSSFWDYGYPAIDVFESDKPWSGSEFNPYYHTTQDTLDKLDLNFALKNTKVCVATICELADPYNLPTRITLIEPDGRNDTIDRGEIYQILWAGTTEQVSLFYATKIDGEKNFLTTVDGALQQKYSLDTNLISGGQYYIYAETQTGDSDWSSGLLTILLAERIHLYPNPFNSSKDYQITFVALPAYTQLKIYNLVGELVYEKEIRNQYRWPWQVQNNAGEKLASGIYVYTISDNNGKRSQGKIAIIK